MPVAIGSHKKKGGLHAYLLARSSTIMFMGLFMAGLAMGSVFCIGSSEGVLLLRAMIQKEAVLQAQRSFAQLVASSLYGFAGILIYVYICVNSLKGNLLVALVPLLHGLSLGATITTQLWLNGYSAISYILLCIFIPKAVQTMLLLSACNKTVRYCKAQAAAGGRKGREGFPIMLYLMLFGFYFVIEAVFVYLFRGLL